ncbi:MAG: tRNA (adenosine(37)-N6)-threonylcarbamoyltransferase complex dimerization subunit type 1 TsaB [Kofleriaceae bacterium]
MKLLGIDTATLIAGLAIVDDDSVTAEARHDSSGRTSDLLVAIDRMCRDAGVAPNELDAIAIGAGPGSFTGLRIGMATAKGIAFAARRPLWAVSSLAALAFDGFAEAPSAPVVVAALDARKTEVFAGCYRRDGSLIGSERVMPPGELMTWVADLGEPDPTFAGDAMAAYPELLQGLASRWLRAATPSGTAVAKLALAGARVDVLTSGTPTYIRPSEAEVKYPDGVPGALRRR